MEAKEKINIILIAGVLIIIAASFTAWTIKRDAQLMEWADKYEQCVGAEYHTTPSEYYQKWGQYPEVINCELFDTMDK
jgi:hypothetical protein